MQDSQNLPVPHKEGLEIAKIKLEIAELQKPFWKRSSFILAGLPTVLAVATLAYGIASGYFSASFVKLENQKHDLEQEVREFTAQNQPSIITTNNCILRSRNWSLS